MVTSSSHNAVATAAAQQHKDEVTMVTALVAGVHVRKREIT